MRRFICGTVYGALTTLAPVLHAQFVTNGNNGVRLVPVDNIAAARSPYYGGNDFQRIATNTPAFEEYGFNLMLSEANRVREKWQLEIPQPLTFRNVYFWLKATPFGIEGSLGTRDGRYQWGFSRSALDCFQDVPYCPISFQHHWDEEARLAKIKSKITLKEAEAVARDSLHKLGLTETQLNLKPSPEVNQYKFEETNGTVYPLPVFNGHLAAERPEGIRGRESGVLAGANGRFRHHKKGGKLPHS